MWYVFEKETKPFFKCQNQCLIRHLVTEGVIYYFAAINLPFFNWVVGGSFSSPCSLSSSMLSKHNPPNISKVLLPTLGCLFPWDTMGRANHCETSHLIEEEHFWPMLMGGAVYLPLSHSNVEQGFAETNCDLWEFTPTFIAPKHWAV